MSAFAPETGEQVDRWPALVDVAPHRWEQMARGIAVRMGEPPLRVAWSALVIGLASRLWAATVVPYVVTGPVPTTRALRLSDEDDGALALGVNRADGTQRLDQRELAGWLLGLLRPVIDAAPLADRLLWGNVASSLSAVPRVHDLSPGSHERLTLVPRLLATPPLAGELIERAPDDARPGLRRITCCLFYLAPEGGLCLDCPFDAVPG